MTGDITSGATFRMAQWASCVSRHQTSSARVEAQRGIKDLLGCMIGGAKERIPRLVAKVALSMGGGHGGPCTLVGHVETVSAPAAAFANGAAAHVLDFDDSFRPLTGHPSCTIVPAIMAVAEEHHKSGDDLLDAYIVGVEISACIGRAAPKHHHLGWHGTATIGVISAAVACARLLGLGTTGCAAAISIAVSSSSGSRLQLGHDVKCIQAGAAARDGVTAAYLATVGITGSPEALTGPWGWLKLYAQTDAPYDGGDEFRLPGASEPLSIVAPGITYKPYPTCGSTHRTLDAVLDLCNKHNIRANDVQNVETTIPALNTANLRNDRPANGTQAKFSMPYTCSVAILYGQIHLSDFQDLAVHRPEVQTFMPKVSMFTLSGSEDTDKTYLEFPCHTKITLKSGVSFEDTRFDRKGETTQPLTAGEEEMKFYDCTRGVLSLAQTEEILTTLNTLSSVPDLGTFMRLLKS